MHETTATTPKNARVRAHAGSRRENKAFIQNVTPQHGGLESNAQYMRRTQGKTFAEEKRKHSRMKEALIALIVFAVICVVALGVGVYTYFKSTDDNLRLTPSNAATALSAVDASEPYYILCAADLTRKQFQKQSPDAMGYIAIRVDSAEKKLTLVTIPARLLVLMSDGSYHPIDEAYDLGGDAELIKAASTVLDAKIAHFITTDASGIAGMVDALGGVKVTINEEVDDPTAGTKVIFAGDQTLTGEEAVVFLRATNMKGGFASCAKNRMDFTLDLALGTLDSTGLGFANAVSEASKFIYTDMTASDLLALGDALRPSSDIVTYECVIPYYEKQSSDGVSVVYEIVSKMWKEMLEQIEAGEDPQIEEQTTAMVDRAGTSVEVRNGTTTVGAAAKLGEKLAGFGYTITKVGNTDDNTIYPETLIVYTSPDYADAAKAIVSDIGAGRVVNGGDFYSSDAKVIAIIGLDWMPVE